MNEALSAEREKDVWQWDPPLNDELRACSWATLRHSYPNLAAQLLRAWRNDPTTYVKADPLENQPRTWESIQKYVRPGHVATLLRQLRHMGKLARLGNVGALNTVAAVTSAAKNAVIATLLQRLLDAGGLPGLPKGLDLHVWATLRRLAPTPHFFLQVIARAVKVWASATAEEVIRKGTESSRPVSAPR